MTRRPFEPKSGTNNYEIHEYAVGCLRPTRILSQGPETFRRSLPNLYKLDSYDDPSLTKHPPFQFEQRERGKFGLPPKESGDYEYHKANISSAVPYVPDDDYGWASSCAPEQV